MKNVFKKNKIQIAILLITAVLLFPAAVWAESTTFTSAPPSTKDANGNNVGQVSGGNEVAPRGFSIDLNGPDEEGGMYWLQSEYDNYNWNPIFTGETNGYEEPIPATDEDGNTITYDFYAWVDRNPKTMIDSASGQPFIALYRDGERVEQFPGTLEAPSRDDNIKDPSGINVSDSAWIKRWKVHFTLQLEAGHDYSLVFLQGIIANNGVTAMVNEEGTGYLKGTLTDEEQEWYDAHKFDEYKYREYKYSTFVPSDTPQSVIIDTSVENPYEGIYRSMRFSFTTRLDESLYQLIADAESLFSKAEAGTAAGQYPQEAIDALETAINVANSVPDDATDEDKEFAAATLKQAIEDFEAQCVVVVESVSIYRNESEFYVGKTGTAKVDVVVTPDKAAHKKVTWSASDNITIDPKSGKWQIDYGGECSITATSQRDATKKDTWNFEVPMEEGTLDMNLSQQTQSGDSKTALQGIVEKASGGEPQGITTLKVSTAPGISLTSEDIDYIRTAFPELVNLDISNCTIESIPDEAFKDMKSLETVEIPEKVKSIGSMTFAGCTSLKEIKLPSTVTEIGEDAFKGCNALSSFYSYSPQAPSCGQGVDKLLADTGVEAVHVPYGCSQGYEAWAGFLDIIEEDECKLEITVTSPGGLEKAAKTALDGSSDNSFDTIIIKGGVKLNDNDLTYLSSHFMRATTIDLSAVKLDKVKARTFMGRIALKKVILPDGVGTIGEQAFYECSNLREIILPAGIDKIGNLAFGNCNSLPEQIIIRTEVPPELSDTAFDKSIVKSFLVPGQSVSEYKNEPVWKDFDIESQIEIYLDRTSITVEEGCEAALKSNVTLKYGNDDSVSWQSSDADIVQVNSSGKITGRKAGTAVVTASVCQGAVSAKCTVTVKKAAAPGVSAVSAGYSAIKLSWNKMSGAEGYEVFRADSQNGNYVKLATTSAISYQDSALVTGRTYYYKVRVYKVANEIRYTGEYSSVASAVPKPSAPSLAAARYTYNGNKLSWSGVAGASGYQIYRSTSSASGYKLVKTLSSSYKSYNNTGLTTGTRYYYKVRAYRTVNGSSVYGEFSSVKSAVPSLSTPGSLSVSKSSKTTVKVKWKGISGETGYQIYRATSKNGKYSKVKSVKMASSKYPYAKIKAKKGKTYYYKVRAYKKVGSKTVYSSFSSPKKYKLK